MLFDKCYVLTLTGEIIGPFEHVPSVSWPEKYKCTQPKRALWFHESGRSDRITNPTVKDALAVSASEKSLFEVRKQLGFL